MEKRTRNNRPVHVTKYCTAPEKFSTETARHNSAIRTLKYLYTVLAKIDTDIKELKTLCNEKTIKNMLHDLEGQRLEEFKKMAVIFFSDYDGSGYYATETDISDVPCVPSEIANGYIRTDFTHVMWYNK